MRSLDRDRRRVFLARNRGMRQVVDEMGRVTGRNEPVRSEPAEFFPTVSAARGEARGSYFGLSLDYDRVLTFDDPDFEIGEADVLWLESEPEGGRSSHDHEVRRVARTQNCTLVAVKRVEVSR